MKQLATCILFLCLSVSSFAQGTFRILDSQLNDVTTGTVFVTDTNSATMQVVFTVENTDSISHDVTAGRFVITQPAGADNAFTWAGICYPPTADTSAIPETITPSGSSIFNGYYFPNGMAGTATINYCFWETTDMNIISCVTVNYENVLVSVSEMHPGAPVITSQPNPAPEKVGVSWTDFAVNHIELYSPDGRILESIIVEPGTSDCVIDLQMLPPGMYCIALFGDNGLVYNARIVHE